jgi:hypothetical protein
MPERTYRLQFDVSRDLLRAIEDFQFRSRIPTRSEAVRELINIGLGRTEKTRTNGEPK